MERSTPNILGPGLKDLERATQGGTRILAEHSDHAPDDTEIRLRQVACDSRPSHKKSKKYTELDPAGVWWVERRTSIQPLARARSGDTCPLSSDRRERDANRFSITG